MTESDTGDVKSENFTEAEIRMMLLLALKMEGGRESSNVISLQDRERTRELIISWKLQKGYRPGNTLILAL